MSGKSKFPLTISTPIPEVTQLTLSQETWDKHIVAGHTELEGQEDNVCAVISSPSVVIIPQKNPNYYLFINDKVTTSRGTPLIVVGCPKEKEVVTVYYNKDYRKSGFRALPGDTVLWLPRR